MSSLFGDLLHEIDRTIRVQPSAIFEAPTATGALPFGASLLKKYELYWTEIRKRDVLNAKYSKVHEERFCALADYFYHLKERFSGLEKELAALPSMQQDLNQLCQDIGQISLKVSRLESCLSAASELHDKRRVNDWHRAKAGELAQLTAHQLREYRESEVQLAAERTRRLMTEEARLKAKREVEIAHKQRVIQANFEQDLAKYKQQQESGEHSSDTATQSEQKSDAQQAKEEGPTSPSEVQLPSPNKQELDQFYGEDEDHSQQGEQVEGEEPEEEEEA